MFICVFALTHRSVRYAGVWLLIFDYEVAGMGIGRTKLLLAPTHDSPSPFSGHNPSVTLPKNFAPIFPSQLYSGYIQSFSFVETRELVTPLLERKESRWIPQGSVVPGPRISATQIILNPLETHSTVE